MTKIINQKLERIIKLSDLNPDILKEIVEEDKLNKCPICRDAKELRIVRVDYAYCLPEGKIRLRRECTSCKYVIEAVKVISGGNEYSHLKIYSDYYGFGTGRTIEFSEIFEKNSSKPIKTK